MKRIVGLVVVGLLVFAVIYRQRLFLWDPLANVSRDGEKVGDVRVMINYSNDVVLDDASAGKHRMYVVQNWNKTADFFVGPLKCIHGMACLTDADQVGGVAVPVGSRGRRSGFEGVTMTNKRVEFVDEDGALVLVTLR